ncbi:MAG: aminotransferase class V-fold PLP-dependent enzyme [Opitutaceae bacterium]
MSLPRRSFLRHAALGAAGLGLARGAEATLPEFAAERPEPFWEAVRALYPLEPGFSYFNTGGLGSTPAPVLERVAEVTRRLQAKAEHGHAQFTAARADVARFLGADPAEVAFVRNATEANATVAAGLPLRAGDEVVFESHAHPGGSFAWLQAARVRGVIVRTFEPEPRSAALNLERVAALCGPRTRVIQLSHITAPTGITLPARAVADLCRSRGIWFHLDAAQSAGMVPVDFAALGCDSLAVSGHKWIGGPLETGVLCVRRARQEELAPPLVGAYSGDLDATGRFALSAGAVRYEYGTRNVATALGLAEAMRLQERIGRDRIAARGRQLAARVRTGLGTLPGVEILSPDGELATAMVTFRTARIPHDRLFGLLLREKGIRSRPVTEEKLNALRISTHLCNSPAQIDALVAAVGEFLRREA